MSTPILATKLYIPSPRPHLIPRTRLLEKLNTGLHGKLTLIAAPAGFGKTTLVSSWIDDLRLTSMKQSQSDSGNLRSEAASQGKIGNRPSAIVYQVAWLSLDEEDSDPVRFLTYLITALQQVLAGFGESLLGLLHSPQPPRDPSGHETLLTALLNELAMRAGTPATSTARRILLVLDDYHVIKSPEIDQTLTFLLEHLPPHLHLVITTREDPNLPLARLRARDQLTDVRAGDLRFTETEAADFLNGVMGLTLSAAEVAALETRTEGWIAGLQLAALSMQGRKDVAGFIKTFAGDNRYIVDYLVEEVLQHQPKAVRSFLLQTAILDQLSGPLCDAVVGELETGDWRWAIEHSRSPVSSLQSQTILKSLEQANLFLIPLDDKRQWYRYHHLFADVLQARAMAEQPDQVPLRHQRASDWYEQNGLRADAIRHALAAKDFVRAAGLIELAWPEMEGRFQSATWLGWAKALPDELVRARPVLSVAYGWALLNGGKLEAAEAWFGVAERWLETGAEQSEMIIVDEAQFRTLPASVATARAYQTQARGDIPGSVTYGQQALALLPADDHQRRGPAAALLALAQWASGDLEEAYQTLAAAMTNFQKVGNLHFAISGTYGLGDIRTVQGRLHDAVKIYRQVLALALAQGEPLLRGTADLYLGLSELYREQGELDAARQHLLKSEELGEQAGLPDWRYRFYRTEARFKETEGDLAGALDRLDAAERHYRRTPVPAVRPLAALKIRVWVAQGRVHEALRWVQEQGLTVDDELSFLREFEHITLARVLLAENKSNHVEGSRHAAMAFLARLRQAAEVGGRTGSVIEILVLQALAHQAQGTLAPALAALERALTLAEPEGYVRIFVDEGAPMVHLLSAAVTHGIMPAYSHKLLAALGAMPPQSPSESPRPAAPHAQPLSEPLSEREREVLKLLGTELNGPEIAQRLMVSLNTMRTHTKNIFNKLGVNNRRAAVRRAEELDLY